MSVATPEGLLNRAAVLEPSALPLPAIPAAVLKVSGCDCPVSANASRRANATADLGKERGQPCPREPESRRPVRGQGCPRSFRPIAGGASEKARGENTG